MSFDYERGDPQECGLYPAVSSVTREVYFLRDGKIIGEGTTNGGVDDFVNIKPKADDILPPEFKPLVEYNMLHFSKYSGRFQPRVSDAPEDDKLYIVDKFMFDIGIAGKRYECVS